MRYTLRSSAALPWLAAVVIGLLAPLPMSGAAENLPPSFQGAVADFLAGRYKECQIGFGRAAAEASRVGLAARAAYGQACCAALRNDVDGAFEALSLALANGFRDLDRAMVDPRLDTLRSDSRWLSFVALTQERQVAHQKTLDPDLLRLYLAQQQDREKSGDRGALADPEAAATLAQAAAARRHEVWTLVEKGEPGRPTTLSMPPRCWSKATVQRRSARAVDLARKALALDPDLLAARPLVATAVDRSAMLAGRPQSFGTQLVEVDGKWQVYDVDPSISDDERAEWGLPPIADAQERAAKLNEKPVLPTPMPRPAAAPKP